jgi:hypothetical protein
MKGTKEGKKDEEGRKEKTEKGTLERKITTDEEDGADKKGKGRYSILDNVPRVEVVRSEASMA